ncbi:MAG: hypothetical protein ACREYE_18060, partial [Gammaproteobacteria bacterium]
RSGSRVPAVLGILMYLNIHCGSCAPAERDLPSLATVFSQTLSAQPPHLPYLPYPVGFVIWC